MSDEQKPLVIKRPPPPLTLPETKSKPLTNMGAYSVFIYGEKKIGKTSFCAQFPDAFFMMLEPGGKGLELRQVAVNSWKDFLGYIKLLEDNPDYCTTIVIDTADILYERCFQHVCAVQGMEHPADQGYGKGWTAIKDEFKKGVNRLMALNKGVIFTSHAQVSTFKRQNGLEFNKVVPTLSNQAKDYLIGLLDIILYYGYYGSQRLITVHGSDAVEAGSRVKGRFMVVDSNGNKVKDPNFTPPDDDPDAFEYLRVHSIPAGADEEETYKNVLRAFDNRQLFDGKPDKDKTGLKEQKAGFKK